MAQEPTALEVAEDIEMLVRQGESRFSYEVDPDGLLQVTTYDEDAEPEQRIRFRLTRWD